MEHPLKENLKGKEPEKESSSWKLNKKNCPENPWTPPKLIQEES